jgi:hypothetical protein
MNDAITDEQMAIYASATTDLRITLESHEQRLAKAKLPTPATPPSKPKKAATPKKVATPSTKRSSPGSIPPAKKAKKDNSSDKESSDTTKLLQACAKSNEKWFLSKDVVANSLTSNQKSNGLKRLVKEHLLTLKLSTGSTGGTNRNLYRVTKQGHACLALLGQSDQQSDEDSGDQQSADNGSGRDDEKTESSDEASDEDD